MRFTDNRQFLLRDVLSEDLAWAHDVEMAVAFVRDSGVDLIATPVQRIIQDNGTVRVLCGRDFGYTQASALQKLSRLGAEIRIYTGDQIFHPKAFLFRRGRVMRAIVGSSNLTASGLEHGVEWNVAISGRPEVLRDGIDSHRDTDVRSILHPLADVARETGVAILAIAHLNKAQEGKAMYRSIGSIGFIAAARAAWTVVKDPRDDEYRLLLPIKNNLVAEEDKTAFRFTFDDAFGRSAP